MNLESSIDTPPCVKYIASGKTLYTTGAELTFGDDLEEWDGGGREGGPRGRGSM